MLFAQQSRPVGTCHEPSQSVLYNLERTWHAEAESRIQLLEIDN